MKNASFSSKGKNKTKQQTKNQSLIDLLWTITMKMPGKKIKARGGIMIDRKGQWGRKFKLYIKKR